jgi:hypothetical protein
LRVKNRMTNFEQMVTDELKYLRTRVDEVHNVVSGHKVKLAAIGVVAGVMGSVVWSLAKP